MKSIVQLHWDYFLLIEKDLVTISETLELSEKNSKSYGPRLVQLILAAGSELDVALKSLARVMCPEHIAATHSRPTMEHFRDMLVKHAREQFSTARIMFLRSEIVLEPWSQLNQDDNSSINWWKNYNDIKHRRSEHYESANLDTTLNLVGALFITNGYLAEVTLEPHYGSTRLIDWVSRTHMSQFEEYYAINK